MFKKVQVQVVHKCKFFQKPQTTTPNNEQKNSVTLLKKLCNFENIILANFFSKF